MRQARRTGTPAHHGNPGRPGAVHRAAPRASRGDREAVLGHRDGRLEVGAEALAAVERNRLCPGGHHARHANRQPGPAGVLEGQRLAGVRVDEEVRVARRRTHLPAVDGHHLVGLGQIDHHEAAAARPGHERLGDAEGAGRCHRGQDPKLPRGLRRPQRLLRLRPALVKSGDLPRRHGGSRRSF